ncbi:MAG: PLP-dependent aminotransferase family protein [Clostridiales bacterium]|jgi:2-aminoadipate transaminase|nr:PLP-dependent aminotransferase family protein [Clostridiales bacterium]
MKIQNGGRKNEEGIGFMEYGFSGKMNGLQANAIREIFKYLSDPEMISFAGGMPNRAALPAEILSELSANIFRSGDIYGILQYGATEGYMPLRESSIAFAARSGITGIGIENTLIISGGQQGIDLTCKIFLDKGDCVLVEDPTYLAVLHILKTHEAKAYGVKADEDGMDIGDLEEKIKRYKPKFIYVVPTFGNPTGKTYSLERRKKILETALKYNVVILEDDPYSHLRFDGESVPSIKSLDKTGSVIYNTSFSKIISPGLRCGVCIADPKIIAKMTLCKQAADVHTSSLSQALSDAFFRGGYLDGHLKSILPVYKNKKILMKDAIKKYMPEDFKSTDPKGGLFIFGEFGNGINTADYFYKALKNKVAYVNGADFFADGSVLNTLRLNFSNSSDEQIDVGMKKLGDIFKGNL